MIIYGVALLSACLVAGMLIGEGLGIILGVEANVGGVGIAMLFLVLACNSERFSALTEGAAGSGVKFWSAMYIPIVVAMAAQQNRGRGGRWRRAGNHRRGRRGGGQFRAGARAEQIGTGADSDGDKEESAP